MAFRGNESPMDFSWQTNRPVDPTSPFITATNKKRKTDPKSIFSKLPDLTAQQGTNTATFDSPNKNTFSSYKNPTDRPFLFSSPSKTQAPSSPYREPSFTTPRKPFDLDFSSGPESSPMAPTDNDETPDGKPLPSLPKSSKKRNSLFNFYGRWAPKSGKGEIAKPSHSSGADTAPKRVQKRRRQAQNFEKQLARAKKESEYDSDDGPSSDPNTPQTSHKSKSRKRKPTDTPLHHGQSSKSNSNTSTSNISWITTVFTFIHTYPDAPTIIAKYLQVFFNAAILSGVLFVVYSFYATIRADVDKASADAYNEILAEMTACTKNYIDNRCESSSRLPALEAVCANWELCMNRDPNAVKRARLSAHTFAEIFNSFVEPISLKTLVVMIVVVGLALVVNNATFTMYRRSQEQQHLHQGGEGWNRHGSGQWGGQYQLAGQQQGQLGGYGNMTPGLPYQTPQHFGWQTAEQQGQRQLEYQESPTRDRGKSKSPDKKR